ncbi:hypothetical protein [Pseudarthrobacter sp. NIBRBAC000502771]|uniref:hypothetical protein n=1 Tax=Pseudarthrobacter sp. NIBRBAC000502771 TaxID=2590774 RepID=UPI001FEDF4D2|nr:hypothetical protein [Pseudarthrobacter sp. NIBRBAC000502771]
MPPDLKPAGPAVAAASTPAPRRPVRALLVLCGAVVACALVAGAAGAQPGGTDGNVLRGFQIRVLSISQAASENRMDGALAALQALEKDLGEAASAGRISATRYRGIEDALSAVRADIATQVAAASASAPAVEQDTPVAPALADTSQEGPAAAEPVVPAAAPAPAAAKDAPGSKRSDTAKEASGKAKGQGKP